MAGICIASMSAFGSPDSRSTKGTAITIEVGRGRPCSSTTSPRITHGEGIISRLVASLASSASSFTSTGFSIR